MLWRVCEHLCFRLTRPFGEGVVRAVIDLWGLDRGGPATFLNLTPGAVAPRALDVFSLAARFPAAATAPFTPARGMSSRAHFVQPGTTVTSLRPSTLRSDEMIETLFRWAIWMWLTGSPMIAESEAWVIWARFRLPMSLRTSLIPCAGTIGGPPGHRPRPSPPSRDGTTH